MSVQISWDEKVTEFEGMGTLPSGHLFRKDVAPGAAWWQRDQEGIISTLRFACPCGCGGIGALPIRHDGWTWDGNEQQPTTKPSIQMLMPCRWHGYLTKGVFESC